MLKALKGLFAGGGRPVQDDDERARRLRQAEGDAGQGAQARLARGLVSAQGQPADRPHGRRRRADPRAPSRARRARRRARSCPAPASADMLAADRERDPHRAARLGRLRRARHAGDRSRRQRAGQRLRRAADRADDPRASGRTSDQLARPHPRGHRGPDRQRSQDGERGRQRAARAAAAASRSTTSAPAIRRSARLRQLPFSELKIDRAYVTDCHRDKVKAGMLEVDRSRWRAASASRPWPRASRPTTRATSCRASACGSARASCSPSRCRRPSSSRRSRPTPASGGSRSRVLVAVRRRRAGPLGRAPGLTGRSAGGDHARFSQV